jgi:hypothetical protein
MTGMTGMTGSLSTPPGAFRTCVYLGVLKFRMVFFLLVGGFAIEGGLSGTPHLLYTGT